jgi:hypothetical protein
MKTFTFLVLAFVFIGCDKECVYMIDDVCVIEKSNNPQDKYPSPEMVEKAFNYFKIAYKNKWLHNKSVNKLFRKSVDRLVWKDGYGKHFTKFAKNHPGKISCGFTFTGKGKIVIRLDNWNMCGWRTLFHEMIHRMHINNDKDYRDPDQDKETMDYISEVSYQFRKDIGEIK